jgi:hypothetical protein
MSFGLSTAPQPRLSQSIGNMQQTFRSRPSATIAGEGAGIKGSRPMVRCAPCGSCTQVSECLGVDEGTLLGEYLEYGKVLSSLICSPSAPCDERRPAEPRVRMRVRACECASPRAVIAACCNVRCHDATHRVPPRCSRRRRDASRCIATDHLPRPSAPRRTARRALPRPRPASAHAISVRRHATRMRDRWEDRTERMLGKGATGRGVAVPL